MEQAEGQSDRATVLVVEDNEAVVRSLRRVLEREGYRVVACYGGLDALAHVEREPPDAVVVDIHLPDISGLVLSSKLRELLGESPPIIVLSGDTSMENLKSLPHVGASYFLSKPLNVNHLLEQLRTLAAD